MFIIANYANDRLLAEAETFSAAKLAARTMFEEGEPLPILIFDGGADLPLARLVSGKSGAELRTSDLARGL